MVEVKLSVYLKKTVIGGLEAVHAVEMFRRKQDASACPDLIGIQKLYLGGTINSNSEEEKKCILINTYKMEMHAVRLL